MANGLHMLLLSPSLKKTLGAIKKNIKGESAPNTQDQKFSTNNRCNICHDAFTEIQELRFLFSFFFYIYFFYMKLLNFVEMSEYSLRAAAVNR